MSYRHVKDEKTRQTTHNIWRCQFCGALCVTCNGNKPPPGCSLCKR